MSPPRRGEVWIVDLGMAAKVRPGLVLSVTASGEERDLVTIIPLTTAARGGRFEVPTKRGNLRGVFDAQQVITIPRPKCERWLTNLPADELAAVETAVRRWLGL